VNHIVWIPEPALKQAKLVFKSEPSSLNPQVFLSYLSCLLCVGGSHMLILRWVTVLKCHSAHKTKQLVTNKLTHASIRNVHKTCFGSPSQVSTGVMSRVQVSSLWVLVQVKSQFLEIESKSSLKSLSLSQNQVSSLWVWVQVKCQVFEFWSKSSRKSLSSSPSQVSSLWVWVQVKSQVFEF